MGNPSGPKYILYSYMDPWGNSANGRDSTMTITCDRRLPPPIFGVGSPKPAQANMQQELLTFRVIFEAQRVHVGI